MGLFGGFSIFSLVSLILTAVGFIVQLIGYSVPYWIKMGNENVGLWKTCTGGLCVGSIHVHVYKPAMLEATQVLETLAFLAILATLIFMGLKVTVMQEQKILSIVIFIQQFTSDCVHRGQIIKNGNTYKSSEECTGCECRDGLISCCSNRGYIVKHDANDKVVPDGPCSEKAVLITDETQPCPGSAGVLR